VADDTNNGISLGTSMSNDGLQIFLVILKACVGEHATAVAAPTKVKPKRRIGQPRRQRRKAKIVPVA
jgi:hypothetical protein